MELTPIELHEDVWLKREDLYRSPSGANGSKYRAAQKTLELIDPPAVLTAASVRSPQHIITATVAQERGIPCTVVVGGTKKPLDHPSVRAAHSLGADIITVEVGYNTFLQSRGRDLAEMLGAYHMPYGLACPPELDPWDVFGSTAQQASQIPDRFHTLVVPFGSSNTAMGILMGLPAGISVKFIGVSKVKLESFKVRAESVGVEWPSSVEFIQTPWDYSTFKRGRLGDVVLHPTYEGKVLTHLDAIKPDWWRQDGTLMWIVGGPIS